MGDVSVVCRGFGEEYSESYRLKEYPLFLTYKNETMEQVDKNWFTPSAIVFSSRMESRRGRRKKHRRTGIQNIRLPVQMPMGSSRRQQNTSMRASI